MVCCRRVLVLLVGCATGFQQRSASRPPRVVVVSAEKASYPKMPGQSMGRISEDEARARTSWPHWGNAEAKDEGDAIDTAAERHQLPPEMSPAGPEAAPAAAAAAREPAAPSAAAQRHKAYTLSYYQELVTKRARHDSLLSLVSATGRLCEVARRPDASADDEVAAVLRALTEYASERGLSLDDLAARSVES